MGIRHGHAVSYPGLVRSDEQDENHGGIAGRDSDAADVCGSGLAERAEAGERQLHCNGQRSAKNARTRARIGAPES